METGTVSVDRWSEGSQVYFLTHLHADHTHGLSSTWKYGLLFCSRITAKLLPHKFPGFNLSLLRVLEVGRWYSVSLVSPTTGLDTKIDIMPIDANHCPGAVMFLFRGEFGYMLYTGDFRWEQTSERAKIGRSMLLNAIGNDKIDIIYLDNTFCHPSYSFPPREVAAQQVVDVIASHPEHDIIIGIDSLGKEDLLFHIARVLKIKIWVWPERLQTMHLLGFHDIFTTKTSMTRVRAVPRYSFSIDTLEGLNKLRPTIGIMPSGLSLPMKPQGSHGDLSRSSFVSHCAISKLSTEAANHNVQRKVNEKPRPAETHHGRIYSVPYSDHSCFNEIEEFVKLVQPSNLKGIVSSSPCCIEPLYHFGTLLRADTKSETSLHNFKRVKVKQVEAVFANSSDGSDNSAGTRKERRNTRKHNFLGVRIRRVSELRRLKRGAKLLET